MRPLLLFVVVSCGAVVAARDQTAFKRTQDFDWKIAQRFDDGRVVIMLSMDDNYLEKEDRAKIVGDPLMGTPMAALLSGVSRAQADWVRKSSSSTAQIGDQWAIDGGRAGWFTGTVDDFLITNAACSEAGALSASIDANQRIAFSRVKEKYFPVRQLGDWKPAGIPARVGPADFVLSSSERVDVERLLRKEVARTSASLLSGMGDEGRDPQYEFFKNAYARLANGEGSVRYDTQAFRLTPDGVPRVFVRSVFRLDKRQVYFLSAWIKTGPTLTVEQSDAGATGIAWMRKFDYNSLDPDMNGEVYNVTDVDRDGTAELLIKYSGYESIWLDVVTYPPGPRLKNAALARWGAGC